MPRGDYDPEQTRELKWLGRTLAQLRQQAGMTQRELAQKAGRSFSQVADVERAASSPGWLLLVDLCQTIGVTMAEFGRAYDELAQSDARNRPDGRS